MNILYCELITANEEIPIGPNYYPGPVEEGTFDFDFNFKELSRDSSELVCYGIDMDHERFVKFSAYAKYVDGKLIYAPRNSCVDMQNAKVASVWTVTLERNKKGKIELTKAKFVENIDDDEGL